MGCELATQGYVMGVEIPENKCPRIIRNRQQLIKDGVATVFLANNTTSEDAENGVTRYGISGGRIAIVVTQETFERDKTEYEEYLKSRFGREWKIKLLPLKR